MIYESWIQELIETLWNVNLNQHNKMHCSSRINRNIVECKYFWIITAIICVYRINRNIVECKSALRLSIARHKIELIETLWNVNFVAIHSDWRRTGELIETLWNVNLCVYSLKGVPLRWINRNIVECKLIWLHDNVAS